MDHMNDNTDLRSPGRRYTFKLGCRFAAVPETRPNGQLAEKAFTEGWCVGYEQSRHCYRFLGYPEDSTELHIFYVHENHPALESRR